MGYNRWMSKDRDTDRESGWTLRQRAWGLMFLAGLVLLVGCNLEATNLAPTATARGSYHPPAVTTPDYPELSADVGQHELEQSPTEVSPPSPTPIPTKEPEKRGSQLLTHKLRDPDWLLGYAEHMQEQGMFDSLFGEGEAEVDVILVRDSLEVELAPGESVFVMLNPNFPYWSVIGEEQPVTMTTASLLLSTNESFDGNPQDILATVGLITRDQIDGEGFRFSIYPGEDWTNPVGLGFVKLENYEEGEVEVIVQPEYPDQNQAYLPESRYTS